MRKKTTIEFVNESRQIHGDRYGYDLVEYVNAHTKVKITCPEHGLFEQKPYIHLQNHGCPECSGKKRPTTDEFISKARQVHGDRYDYSLVEYINNKSKIKIVCPVHGVFEQKPNNHLNGQRCHGCGCAIISSKKSLNTEDFITKAKQMHGDKYDYSLVEYRKSSLNIKIVCKDHGMFEQTPNTHLSGGGCGVCAGNIKSTTDEFIFKAKQVHGDRYGYDLVEYNTSGDKVKIVCISHGVFRQRPSDHLRGRGCSVCAKSISKQELELLDYIKSIYKGKIVTNTRSVISPYELDIYLPDIHKAFEYNGMYWHNEGLTKPVGYHQMKNDLCAHRGINLMHIWEHDWMNDNDQTKNMVRDIIRVKQS